MFPDFHEVVVVTRMMVLVLVRVVVVQVLRMKVQMVVVVVVQCMAFKLLTAQTIVFLNFQFYQLLAAVVASVDVVAVDVRRRKRRR